MLQNGRVTDGQAAESSVSGTDELQMVENRGAWNRIKKVAISTVLGGATSAELGVLDGATAGTQVAGKAVIANADVNTGISKITELHIGATGSETQVDATAAELNTVADGIVATAAQLNATETDAGVMAHTVVDFNAVGTATMTITINSVVYLEADAEDFPNGVWTNGASAADSATSLIAAINGDTRATVPFTAKADVSGDGVVLTADAVGTAGNLTCASSDGSATTSNFLGGLDIAAVVQTSDIVHITTADEVLSTATVIPVAFIPRCVQMTVLKDTTGAILHLTSLVTIGSAPNSIIITADGATNLAAGDIVHLHVTA